MPAPGEQVPVDTEIQLLVAKIDDAGVAELLPVGSPVLVMLEDEAAEKERQRQEQEAADVARAEEEAAEAAARAEEEAAAAAAELQGYVEQLDPAMRIGVQLVTGIADFANEVRGGTVDDWSFQLGADTAMEAGQALVDGLAMAGPPESAGRQAESGCRARRRRLTAPPTHWRAPAAQRETRRWLASTKSGQLPFPSGTSALSAHYAGTIVTPPQVR